MLALIVLGALFSGLFLFLAWQFHRGKGISWVNFLDGTRQEYDEKKLLRFLSRVMVAFSAYGLCLILSGIGGWPQLRLWGLLYLLCLAAGVLIYLNTGGRFRKR